MHTRQTRRLVGLDARIHEGRPPGRRYQHVTEHRPDTRLDDAEHALIDRLIPGTHQGGVTQPIAPSTRDVIRVAIRLGIQHQRPGLPADQGHAPGELGILGDIDALVRIRTDHAMISHDDDERAPRRKPVQLRQLFVNPLEHGRPLLGLPAVGVPHLVGVADV